MVSPDSVSETGVVVQKTTGNTGNRAIRGRVGSGPAGARWDKERT